MADTDNRRRIDVMVSCTFLDFRECREAVGRAIAALDMNARIMDKNPGPDFDAIGASLDLVDRAEIYLCLLGRRYGDCPVHAERNPDALSLTEIEFNRAFERRIPRIIFQTGREFLTPQWINELVDDEGDAGRAKRQAFHQRVARDRAPTPFNTAQELEGMVMTALRAVRDKLEREARAREARVAAAGAAGAVPSASAAFGQTQPTQDPSHFCPLNMPYVVKTAFVGRAGELARIDEWARGPAGGLLLFRAIGGMGKSALTWHWVNQHATRVGRDWAGRMWYSFYEKNADLKDFLSRTVSHVREQTGGTAPGHGDLTLELRQQLDRQPWLLVLDGLERILNGYDGDQAGTLAGGEDEDALSLDHRKLLCVRPEDEDVLRMLAQTGKSKVLASSRLLPASLAIEGVTHIALDGLSPVDGAQLLLDAGVETNDRERMQDWLQETFACHPLSLSVIPGLIDTWTPYGPLDFDKWMLSDTGGQAPELLAKNLKGRQNHILAVALDTLAEKDKALLYSLCGWSTGYTPEIIEQLNPKASPSATEAETRWLWRALPRLAGNGLIQYVSRTRALDIHPVVRVTVLTRLSAKAARQIVLPDTDALEALAVDVFEDAETVADLAPAIARVRALCADGQMDAAAGYYADGLSRALTRVGAWKETLELLKVWFPNGWEGELSVGDTYKGYILNDAAIVLGQIGEPAAALSLTERSLMVSLKAGDTWNVAQGIANLGTTYYGRDRLRDALIMYGWARRLAEALNAREIPLLPGLYETAILADAGELDAARTVLAESPEAVEDWGGAYQYQAMRIYTRSRVAWRAGELTEAMAAEALLALRRLKRPNSELYLLVDISRWRQVSGNHAGAILACREAYALALRSGAGSAANIAAMSAISQLALGQTRGAAEAAAAAAESAKPSHSILAELYLALGDRDRALVHADKGYREAWADGPPYYNRWSLERCSAVLETLGAPKPVLPEFDPERHPALPFAGEVEALIAKTLDERAAREEAERLRAWREGRGTPETMPAPGQHDIAMGEDEMALVRANLSRPRGDMWAMAPVVAGEWTELAGEDAFGMLTRISSWLDQAGVTPQIAVSCGIDRVRTSRMACYPAATLVEMQGYTEDGRAGVAGMIVHPAGVVLLNGESLQIHAMNEALPPAVHTEAGQLAYLALFMNWVHGDEGRFQPVPDIATLRSRMSAGAEMPEGLALEPPLRAADQHDAPVWQQTILYSNALFRADITVPASGVLNMLDDEPIAAELPVVRERMVGPLLVRDDAIARRGDT